MTLLNYLYHIHHNQKKYTMLVKLNERILNLDLVKEISEVCAFLVNEKRDDITKYVHVLAESEVANWLENSTTGNKHQQEYDVVFGFQIFYLEEKYPKQVKVSLVRNEAVKAREALATLLNGNQPVIHQVKY